MRHLVRSLVLSLTAVVTLGVVPAATAVPRHTGGVAVSADPDDTVTRLRNRLADRAEAKEEQLSQISADITSGDLTDDQKLSLGMDVRYSLQALSALAGSIGEAATVEQLRGYQSDLHEFYPHVYDLAVDFLLAADDLAERIAANDALIPGLRAEYGEQAQAANDAARTALGNPAVYDLSAYHGRDQAPGLRAAKAGLADIRAQLRVVDRIVAEERRFARLQNRVLARAEAKLTELSQIQADVVDSNLTDEAKIGLGQQIEHDGFALADLRSAVSAATSLEQLEPLAEEVGRNRPHTYDVVLSVLEQAPGLQDRIVRDRAALAAITDRDVSAGTAAAEAADAALSRALGAELTITSSSADVQAVRVQLAMAKAQLRIAERVLRA